MKSGELKNIISQIRKYNLEKVFETPEDLDKWLKGLNNKQINNFLSLKVEPNEIQFPLCYLIDDNLLNCDDYQERIKAMTKLKNAEGWYHLYDNLCSPNFLDSNNYYEDMEMIAKAPSAQYPLWIIDKDVFINSPYHQQDLKLIVEAKDTEKEEYKKLDWLVAEALTIVAGSANSINSPYHQQDMELIAHAGSECLQISHSYPEYSLNNLAINEFSLKDKYHLENMQILAKNPIASIFLYELMTNPETINGQYYREEVKALASANSMIKAVAMYCYIANPDDFDLRRKSYDYQNALWDLGLDFNATKELKRRNSIKGNSNPKYLKYLELLNQIDDKKVLFVESLLSNQIFASSEYCDHDIDLLLSIEDENLFTDIYRVMSNETSLTGSHHISDLDIISKTKTNEKRKWLISKAIDDASINSDYHDYDMEYIKRLDLNSIDKETLKEIHYYLFIGKGINHPNHVEILEKLSKGETIQSEELVLKYLDYLEKNPDVMEKSVEEKPKLFSRFFQRYNKE